MSIISEALKKANAERGGATRSATAVAAPSRVNAGRVLATLCVLTIVITPFLIPRFVSRFSVNEGITITSVKTPDILPLADAPEIRPETGLAQMSIESRDITTASIAPKSMSPHLSASSPELAYTLQGTVWTRSKGRYAILNSNVVREGSLVGKYRVDQIADGKITLTDGSQTITIDKSI